MPKKTQKTIKINLYKDKWMLEKRGNSIQVPLSVIIRKIRPELRREIKKFPENTRGVQMVLNDFLDYLEKKYEKGKTKSK